MSEAVRNLPGVTVIIPAYNYAAFVAEAIRSALVQDYAGPRAVLVVDDGSTDDTPQVVGSFGAAVQYHRKVNAGLSAARNTGMELSSHDLVVFLDADDVLEPQALSVLVTVWRNCGERKPLVVGSKGRMIGARGEWLSDNPEACDGGVESFRALDFVLRNRFAPIVLADRAALLSLGGFDPELAASEDRDMWIRVASCGDVKMIRAALHRKRDHGTNMSRHATRQTDSILRVLAKAQQSPGSSISARVWAEAEAICLFQSARMHLNAGNGALASRQCLRSITRAPWLGFAKAAGFPAGFRTRFLMIQAGRLLGLFRSKSACKAPAAPLTQAG